MSDRAADRIVQVSPADVLGGAEAIARMLLQGCLADGRRAHMIVGEKVSRDRHVVELPHHHYRRGPRRWLDSAARKLVPADTASLTARRIRRFAGNPGLVRKVLLGRDAYDYPASGRLGELVGGEPGIVHCHNLAGFYFDLRSLIALSQATPIFVTMHDAWLLAGGCTHPNDCDRWRTGCGQCPQRARFFSPIALDGTAKNWQAKRNIYARCTLNVIAPSQWLLAQVAGSILEPAVASARVIPNGVDVDTFTPGSRNEARQRLGLHPTAPIALFVAQNARGNTSKDYPTLEKAVANVSDRLAASCTANAADAPGRPSINLVVVGDRGRSRQVGRASIHFVPFVNDVMRMVHYYRAADVYVHAARVDTFPNTILEAMACGLPVVASAVGGIPEQVDDGRSGYLVPAGDADRLANRMVEMLGDSELRERMGQAGLARVRRQFTLGKFIESHLRCYDEAAAQWRRPSD